ncbi:MULTISPECIES: homoserine dehydrogenase [Nocardiopsis]|uniref:Homoserine dehydrogenase n=1 Tax=Nocardiopsis dassonvillei (strain ATCC 23218 / DSM 43111 / CIP 107115 / JCM 7437 / KCTC 9190 / NBRC 14626 / NCTC 10488 / NRRL B-5397 / IMRU 509) TaxID=446468 RepID=D7AVA5_NOCDD|nr:MULTISPECIES: homoserine dehydrogenase [Nocardiopsis]ADH65766.1 Homoserine dehydrogenase [Nocardiopsis dassonvillei subsp. dassonvillei DSM 43111]APC34109.1 homoserine dehydrogenase [Nocardiopsis dassonvillei]ASU56985.1 homoserine dehydrogenase [Nocardiopsis dassonvillei]NKY78812.1 homoserine dehydrogenase [Nocardiopsis dassonvillei]VEI91787.1 Homoserine dehydrogenase [Nocardiopsis dassonvillei]
MAMKVALLGCGVVGSEVVRLVNEQSEELAARVGTPIEIGGIAVRRLGRDRGVDPALLTTDATALATRPDIDLVVEVIGGIEPARSLILAAIKSGKSVVTANKALLAEDGQTLHAAARDAGVDLYYEASVAGAIPLLRPLRDSLAGDRVNRVLGIVNGTTNYILDRMDSLGAGFTESLEQAQALGYAEADPTADVEGFDAAAKAAILARLAFHTQRVTAADVHREGITGVSAGDIASARAMGCVVKLLAICQRSQDGGSVGVRVHPVMLPVEHPLASVKEAYNAVFVEAESAGRLMFYGAGAGGTPTASAVLGDLVAVARNRLADTSVAEGGHDTGLPVHDMGETITSYHVALDVADRPGVLSKVAEIFADHGVSIKNVRQEGSGDDAQLVLVSHPAPDAALSATVEDLRVHDMVREVASVMRVETFAD